MPYSTNAERANALAVRTPAQIDEAAARERGHRDANAIIDMMIEATQGQSNEYKIALYSGIDYFIYEEKNR